MNEVVSVKIEERNGVNVVSSRVVAEQLGKRHADVLSKIKEVLTEREFSLSEYLDSTGRKLPECLLTKDGFILLCMNYTGYNDFKRAYIAEFNRMEKELKMTLPKTYKEALLALVEAEEEKEKLQIENNEMKDAVTQIKSNLNNLEADVRTNVVQAIRRLVDVYCKMHRIFGVNREIVYREMFQTVYTGFCKEYDIDFSEIKSKEYTSLKTGKPTKTKQSFIKIIESMGYQTLLMEYAFQLKVTDVNISLKKEKQEIGYDLYK